VVERTSSDSFLAIRSEGELEITEQELLAVILDDVKSGESIVAYIEIEYPFLLTTQRNLAKEYRQFAHYHRWACSARQYRTGACRSAQRVAQAVSECPLTPEPDAFAHYAASVARACALIALEVKHETALLNAIFT
jgi:high-affinity K+ transport system ATPase subunit B